MKDHSLGDIIKNNKAVEAKKLIKGKRQQHPYSQPLLHLQNKLSKKLKYQHFTYDWYSDHKAEDGELEKDVIDLALIKIPGQKSKLRKKKSDKKKKKKKKLEKKEIPSEVKKAKSQQAKKFKKKKDSKKSKKKSSKSKLSTNSHWERMSPPMDSKLVAYTKWLNSIYPDQSKPLERISKSKKKKQKRRKKQTYIHKKIDSSVKERKDIVSESLAQLYTEQGHFHKAIEMYEKLRLENPEKSHFFAPLIEDLKSKLK